MALVGHQLIDEGIRSWADVSRLRLFTSSPEPQEPVVRGECFYGTYATIVRLETHDLNRMLFRNHPELLSLAFAESGICRGGAARRPFRTVPGRFTWVLLPEEVLDMQFTSKRFVGYIIQLPVKMLGEECALHGVEDPSFLTLGDAVPGHETLLIACARQLLELRGQSDSLARARVALPLEASILSLLASLVSSAKPLVRSDEPLAPQSIHVQNALSFFEEHLSEPITLTDLCRACNVSARTLQVAFQAVMERSPLQVLQEMRLTRLNQLLRQRIGVAQACDQAGLHPSGRMAGNYKRMFGELPSQTRRNAGA